MKTIALKVSEVKKVGKKFELVAPAPMKAEEAAAVAKVKDADVSVILEGLLKRVSKLEAK